MPSTSPYLIHLNDEQRAAVVHGKAPLLILAGAGSGKTRVVTTRIAYLIDQLAFLPEQILAVTFTNKAAREMQERVNLLLADREPGEASGTVLIKTFHSFCAWFLRRNAASAGLDPYFGIYDDEDSLALVKTVLPEHLSPHEARNFLHSISRAKDDDLTPDDELGSISFHPDFPEVYRSYEEKLTTSGNVDFGGLILKTVRLLRNHEGIRSRIRQKFLAILVDEYQDCNGAQSALLEQLFGPATWLTVVGDDDQSIYGFRGADVRHILDFSDRFPGTSVVRLEENYRSTSSILAIASQVVQNNRSRLGKTLWTKNPEGKLPKVVYLPDQETEAAWAVDLIRRSPLLETAVLYRTNAQSRSFESALVRAKLPYRIVGSVRFYEREEVKDVLAWLKLLANPRDEVAFQRILNKPARGLGKSATTAISENRASGRDWIDACQMTRNGLKGKAKSGLESFLGIFQRLSGELEKAQHLTDSIQEVITQSGLVDYHAQSDSELGTSRLQNLDELLNAASPFSGGKEGLSQFLETVELDAAGSLEKDENRPGVTTLITMHNTKGLEFDRVLITGLEEGLFPREAEVNEELEEERRLFYVAVTRAREELFFSSCASRLIHGRFQSQFPSRFLNEIDPHLVEVFGKPSVQDSWRVGQRVYHEDFGVGTVVKKWYTDEDLTVDVRFDSGRMGRFLPKYTPLEKVADDA